MEINKDIIEKAQSVINSEDFIRHLKSLAKPIKTNKEEVPEKIIGAGFDIYIDEDIEIDEKIVHEFIDFCLTFLKIEDSTERLKVVLSSDKEAFQTYAFYNPNKKLAAVYAINRATLDIFRSLAHELVHFKQDLNNEISDEQGGDENDGVPIENEANAVAGVILRKFGREHKDLY